MLNSFFHDRKVAIATMHQKEVAIAPLLKQHLGLCSYIANINTDVFGTFSGEIKRILTPVDALKEKCFLAIKNSNCDLVVASEGSFGPHPELFFLTANEELVMLFDEKNQDYFIGKHLTTQTNFGAMEVKSVDELLRFAYHHGFPSHGLILKNEHENFSICYKGIRDKNNLIQYFEKLLKANEKVIVETDMRAMMNPTRIKSIAKATQNLIEKIKHTCPQCNYPGFDVAELKKGLPCEECGMPTKSILSLVYQCKKCTHSTIKMYPKDKQVEIAMYCDWCNP